eukprot:scaffold15586_cov100-Isochrysis_galbana.AAC.7
MAAWSAAADETAATPSSVAERTASATERELASAVRRWASNDSMSAGRGRALSAAEGAELLGDGGGGGGPGLTGVADVVAHLLRRIRRRAYGLLGGGRVGLYSLHESGEALQLALLTSRRLMRQSSRLVLSDGCLAERRSAARICFRPLRSQLADPRMRRGRRPLALSDALGEQSSRRARCLHAIGNAARRCAPNLRGTDHLLGRSAEGLAGGHQRRGRRRSPLRHPARRNTSVRHGSADHLAQPGQLAREHGLYCLRHLLEHPLTHRGLLRLHVTQGCLLCPERLSRLRQLCLALLRRLGNGFARRAERRNER